MKVYFNNSCKICKAEIDLYKKEKIQEIDWVDITNNQDAEVMTSKSKKELLRRLHVIHEGELVGGAKAFIIVWSKIPKYHFLSKIFKFKPLYVMFHYLYEIIAFFLYLKNKKQIKD